MSDSLTTETAATQAAPDYVNEREEGRKALKELLKPVQGSLMIGRILAGLSGVLAIAPYIALVQLGGLFATAYATGQPVDADRAMLIVQILISTFCLRILLLFIALGVTHFADARFVSYVRARTIERVGNAPLGWFTSTNSGRIRKALHDDVAQIHTMVAHQPVEMTQAMIMPVALLIYAFYVDWRLGLLSIATLPLYGLDDEQYGAENRGNGCQTCPRVRHHGGAGHRHHGGEGLRQGGAGTRKLPTGGRRVRRLL